MRDAGGWLLAPKTGCSVKLIAITSRAKASQVSPLLGLYRSRLRVGHLDVRPAVAAADQNERRQEAQCREHRAAEERALETLGESVLERRRAAGHDVTCSRGG